LAAQTVLFESYRDADASTADQNALWLAEHLPPNFGCDGRRSHQPVASAPGQWPIDGPARRQNVVAHISGARLFDKGRGSGIRLDAALTTRTVHKPMRARTERTRLDDSRLKEK
jgi:hypothetical protein